MNLFNRKKKKEDQELLKRNHDEIAKALEIMFASDYIDKKKLYVSNFLRGIAFSAGGIIGATVAIALLLWILSLFDQLPFVGPIVEGVQNTIKQGQDAAN